MSNGLNGVNIAQIAQKSLDTLVAKLPLMSLFSTDFSADVGVSGESVTTRIPTGTTIGSLSAGYADSEQDANTTAVTMTLGDVTGFVIGFNDGEWSKSSINLDELFVKQGVNAVASKVINSTLALATSANFGTASFTGVASAFNADSVADIAGVLSNANVPADDRYMILNPSYFTSLTKDDTIKYSINLGNETVKTRQIPMLAGFAPVAEYSGIPANSENLVGIAGGKSALCIATRVPATPAQFNGEVQNVTDPESGLTIQVRHWYSQDKGKHYLSMGILYGVQKGNADALKRIVSA